MAQERVVSAKPRPEERPTEVGLRPRRLSEYVGQEQVVENLSIAISAAKARDEALDHILLYGPPGLGKTTLGGIIASEMGVSIRITSGPAVERLEDRAQILHRLW